MREILGVIISQKISLKLSFEGMLVYILIVWDRFTMLIIYPMMMVEIS